MHFEIQNVFSLKSAGKKRTGISELVEFEAFKYAGFKILYLKKKHKFS